jgi:pimeloyl-ACP methyl ester carboxylesterase
VLPEHREVRVDGTPVRYRAWGPPDGPGLVLVHGGGAHSGWWDHIAPYLGSHRVVAPDLSGHGDSGRRADYGMQVWAREIATVIAAEGLDRPVVVGHSLGGWVALTTGAAHPDAVSAVAYVDSPLYDQPPEESRLAAGRRPARVHPSLAAALARFRPVPGQDVVLPYVGDHIARQSLRRVEGGWTWKFDRAAFGAERPLLRTLLPELELPVALFRCELGLVTPAMAAEMARLVPHGLPVVDVPAAGHHPMLDQPLALVTGLRSLLALWPVA